MQHSYHTILPATFLLIGSILSTDAHAGKNDKNKGSGKWTPSNGFSTDNWCADLMTICIKSPNASNPNLFTGVRFLAEARVSAYYDFGSNGFDDKLANLTPSFGLETNIFKSYAGVQLVYFGPAETAMYSLDEEVLVPDATSVIPEASTATSSPNTYSVETNGSFAVGLSLLDSWISIGVMGTMIPKREFIEPNEAEFNDRLQGGMYFSVSPSNIILDSIAKKKETNLDTAE